MAGIDLHAHTAASDGSDSPAALVEAAARAGVEVLAVSDHDTVAAVAAARAAGEPLGVEVLAACELTVEVGGRVVHVLLYGEGLLAADLADAVEVARRGRERRNREIGERLEALTGVGYQAAAAVAGPSALSRAHFARALVAAGAVADAAEAFDRYLSSGRPAYVPAPSVSVADAVALAGKAGGVAVLAHPGRLPAAERDRLLAAACEAGVDGVEVWHPQHDAELAAALLRTVRRRGLLATGGSDYHGTHKPGVLVGSGAAGNVRVPAETLQALRERLAPSR
ncbi:MAG TPA: PHP domain-containing protein [Actinomycetes bacterium]|jgi:predicted metal-dependent phosphoesterase TrpH|nr:PHP domain-containing protein [Actinomycetes bacterium]